MTDLELPSTADEPPPEIPGYRLSAAIGEGGMGRVYRATQLSLQRPAAVKVLNQIPGRPGATAFQRESRLMASLTHSNLVTVFDCGRVDDRYFIVTELVPGPTLRPLLIPGEPWPVDRAAVVLDRIAQAIGYIHAKGVLHLDLKPENILLGAGGEPKITDFGLALADTDALADPGPALGTLDYSAPEQRFGLPTSERTDLFALAVMAYEMLTGSLPGRVYTSAPQLNPDLPAAADAVLRRGLARSPEDRYATVEDFRRDLVAALAARRHRGRRRAAVAAAGLAVGIVTLLVGWRRGGHDPVAPGPPPPVQAWIVFDRPELAQWLGGDADEPALRGVLVQGRAPVDPDGPPVPAWPNVRPVLVVSAAGTLGFVHPVSDPTLGRRVLRDWRRLTETPPIAAEDNFCRVGDFAGDCVANSHDDEVRPWRMFDPGLVRNGDVIATAEPPDRPGNPALRMVRRDLLTQGQEFGCYQWLARVPEREGTVVVLRYRARADDGEGRLAIRVQLPLLLPAGASDETARRLRAASIPCPDLAHKPDEEPRQYRLDDWVTPGREWQS